MARPIPKVGSEAAASTSERPRAGPTPIGVPVPWCTTRSPTADLPGVLPETPVITASTSQPTTMAPPTMPAMTHGSSPSASQAPTPTRR